jgi:hypothetical protein
MNFKTNLLHFFSLVGAVALLSLTSLNIDAFLNKENILGSQVSFEELEKEKTFWLSLVNQYPLYQVAWLELVQIETLMGNTQEAYHAFTIAQKINPHTPKITEVKKSLKF